MQAITPEVQEELYAHYKENFPEAAPILDRWIMPGMENTFVVDQRGTMTAEFNRYSLRAFYNSIPPEFGGEAMRDLFDLPEMPQVPGYTPDIAAQQSLVNVIARLLGRYRSPGRKYKTGALREMGGTKNLIDGFNS